MVQFSYYPYCGGEGWELEEFRRLAANLMADSRRHPLPKSHAMAENHLRILHLSDLHERVALPWMSDERKAKVRLGAAGRFRVLGAGFLKILREIRQAGPLHAVCFSGDAADWGLPEEYARVTRRLDEILAAVGVPRDRLFLIPGNHDVQRKTSEPAWKGMRRLIGDQRHSLSQWMAGSGRPNRVPQSWRDEILARTAAYHQWVQGDLARPDLHPSQCPHGRLGYRVTVSDLGFPFPVHVIGLDSAWLCGDDNDAGKLLLTQAQVGLNTTDKEGRPFPGFRLAMVHHPLADIADGADSRRCLAGTVDLLLHGHQHDPIAEEQADPDRTLRVIAAGSLYEGDEGDRWLNSFHVIDVLLNDDGRPLCYDVEFWGWSSRGHWHRTGAIYQAARDGRLRWWTPLGEEWRRKQPVPLVNVERERVFVGREAELADLEQALLPAAGAPRAVVVCSVQGMAGVGKTWLVEHFYADHMEAFPGGLLRLVLDPTVPASPQDLFGRLADALKMPAGDRNALAEELRRQRLLIHMENVDDRPLAAVAATMAAQLTGVPLAITGRYQGFAGGPHWRTVPLSSFDPPTAADQLAAELTSESAGRIPVADRGRLAGALGGLPLGIHLAAGYLNAGFAVDAFLDYLRQRGLSLEPFAPNDGNYRERTHVALAATLDLSLELLERSLDGDVSVKLAALCYLGLAPRAGFGLGLATAITGLDETATTVLLAQAHSLSLVERVPSDERPDNAWRVHALLAERFRARLADDDRDAAASRMRAWFLEHLAAGDIDT
jgi:hypothetical protein